MSLATRLARRDGWHVVFYGPPTLAPEGCTAVWPPLLRVYPSLDILTGGRLVQDQRIDVMHFTANSGWIRRRPTLPFVLTVHDAIFLTRDPARSPRQRAGHAYQAFNVRRSARTAAAVVAPTRTAAVAVKRALDLPVEPLVIPNGVVQVASAVSQPSAGPYLAFGGRDPRKRLDVVVHAWRASGTRVELHVLAGAGLPPDFVETNAADLGRGRIRLLPYLSAPDLGAVLSDATALIYPSENEGFGLPVIEAMTHGTPVITGGCDATAEVAGEAALLLDRADPISSVRDAILRLEREPALRESLARKGRLQAARFSWDACADRYAELYARISD